MCVRKFPPPRFRPFVPLTSDPDYCSGGGGVGQNSPYHLFYHVVKEIASIFLRVLKCIFFFNVKRGGET
jgi:hypothetical protein